MRSSFPSHLLKLLLIIFTSISPLLTNQQSIDLTICIGIGIGGGGTDCSPPSPPEPEPCDDFLNDKQRLAYNVIQRFGKTITCDPRNITSTWVGNRPCNYRGFLCEAPPNAPNTPTIASVDFNGFGLCAPTISGFIDQLPDLAIFHANSNNFSGSVPDLRNLTFLYELDLSNNKLSGQFPPTLLPLNQLIFLDIRFNSFAGSVPGTIFLLDLAVLFLNNNGFSQPLPASIGSSKVLYLTLANNGFTGSIPPSIGNSSIIEVLLLNNKLSGCLPCEIGLLQGATVFDAGFNRITGPIPLSFGCLKKVEQLNLAGNLLYGTVPDVVCELAKFGNLKNLSLSGNYFTSVGLSCWELIKKGVLDVRRNCIVGLPEQRSPWDCACFFAKPKYCPLVSSLPGELYRSCSGVRAGAAGAARGGAGTVTYKALDKGHGK